MGFGLYGKLPQKRDFVAFGVPRPVLEPFEVWLQSAVAASRNELGRAWEEAFLVAPLWRFWIGPEIFGANCAGVLMPSVDGVGRYFPLVAIYTPDAGRQLPPPPFAPQGDCFAAIEARLLSVLDAGEEGAATAVDTLLAGLASPSTEETGPAAGVALFRGSPLWRGEAGGGLAALLTGIVEGDYREATKVRSFWWTAGGGEGRPLVHAREGLPDPYFYTRMLRLVAD